MIGRLLPALLFAGAVTTAAGDVRARPADEVGLRVVVTDNGKATPARATVLQAFARAFDTPVAPRSVEGGVHCEAVAARAVANRLKTGPCDAVLLIGGSRPRALRRIAAVTLAGDLGPACGHESVYLVILNADAHVQRRLTERFVAALGEHNGGARGPSP